MGPARIYPCRKMHRSRAPSIAPGTFFVAQPWADCITNMPGFNLRKAQPADHGLRPDDLQSVQHARCQPIQPGKSQTVDCGKGYSLRRFTSQNVKLMTKRQDLCLQRRSRPEQSDQRQPDQAASISHQPRASPTPTSLASRIEFPTMTTVPNTEMPVILVVEDEELIQSLVKETL